MKYSLTLLLERFAICRLSPQASLPNWAADESFCSFTRTKNELSIVCSELNVPESITCERGWRILRVNGVLDFSLTGILSGILKPLAEARISIFAQSTFDTDYILVQEKDLEQTLDVLQKAGYSIGREN